MRSSRRWQGWLVLLAGLAAALACNFPGISPSPSSQEPDPLLLQTAVAELLATAQAERLTPAPTPFQPLPQDTPSHLPPGAPPDDGVPGITPAPALPTMPLPGATPVLLPTFDSSYYLYTTQSGDTLPALAGRFEVELEQITSAEPLPAFALLPPGQLLAIPNQLGDLAYTVPLLPDSEVIFSPSTIGFDVQSYAANAGGYLTQYVENVGGETLTGPQVVQRIALETSVNPRLLLAFLEHRAGWVHGPLRDEQHNRYPLGFYVPGYQGLYKELSLTAKQLNSAFYGWRIGHLPGINFPDATGLRLSPALNPGSVAVQYLFAQFYRQAEWEALLYGGEFLSLHESMFGNAWLRAASVEPLFPAGVGLPKLELPFAPGERWSFTGGPHSAWTTGSPRGGLDFAPVTGEPACAVSRAWVTASAPGLVVRAHNNTVVIDLDGDGYEQTGWTVLYLHLADRDLVEPGVWVNTDDRLGHPSCEGGRTTGTHVHIARKYNGEWLSAAGPLPFLLSGWVAEMGARDYEGRLINGDDIVQSQPDGSHTSIIVR